MVHKNFQRCPLSRILLSFHSIHQFVLVFLQSLDRLKSDQEGLDYTFSNPVSQYPLGRLNNIYLHHDHIITLMWCALRTLIKKSRKKYIMYIITKPSNIIMFRYYYTIIYLMRHHWCLSTVTLLQYNKQDIFISITKN